MDRRRSLLKIAALRTERERQQSVDCSQGCLQSLAAGLLAEGPRTLECLFKYAPSDKMQMIAGFSSFMMEVDLLSSANQIRFYCGGTFATAAIVLGNNYLAHISYDGTTAICYLNGTEAARFTVTGYKVTDLFRAGSPSYAPKGSLVFCRHYNYALSAEEVATHYNNGDPAGYVLSVPYKFRVADYISDFSKNADGWFAPPGSPGTSINTGEGVLLVSGDSKLLSIQNNGMASGDKPGIFRVRITFAVPFTGSMVQVFAHSSLDYAYLTLSVDKLKAEGIVHLEKSLTTRGNAYIYLLDVPIGDVVKISTITIESVGCIAEYLPQNLVAASLFSPSPPKLTGETTFTWNGDTTNPYYFQVPLSSNLVEGNAYKVVVAIDNYESGKPFFKLALNSKSITQIPAANGTYELYQIVYGVPFTRLFVLYGGDGNTSRRLSITIKSIEPVNNIAGYWLDSAKQLPLNNEYLPPLLESYGDYDLTAVGTPEIIIK